MSEGESESDPEREYHLSEIERHVQALRGEGPTGEDVTPWDFQLPSGGNLKQMREICGMTRAEAADAIDYSKATVRNVEHGKPPGREFIQKTLILYRREWPR